MDSETNTKMVYMMEPFIRKFNGVHLNKILDIQNKDFKNLHTLPKHMDENNKKSLLCYQKALGACPGNCNFRHIAGNQFLEEFVVALCNQIRPGMKMIMSQGYLPDRNKRQRPNGKKCYVRTLRSIYNISLECQQIMIMPWWGHLPHGNCDFSMTTQFVMATRYSSTYYTSWRRSVHIGLSLQIEWTWRNSSFHIGL